MCSFLTKLYYDLARTAARTPHFGLTITIWFHHTWYFFNFLFPNKGCFLLIALPPAEPKSPPESLFFKVSELANANFHLLEKHFTDCVIGLVA